MIRSDFRDTWLFDLVLLNDSRYSFGICLFFFSYRFLHFSPTSLVSKIPDTITTWAVSTFSFSGKHGFCLNEDTKIVAFKDIFMKITFPRSIVVLEHTQILVHVFNYKDQQQLVQINYTNLESICSDHPYPLPKITKNVKLAANSKQTVAFAVMPIKPGKFFIEISLTKWEKGQIFFDHVIKELIVNMAGVESEHSVYFNLDPSNRTRRGVENFKNNYLIDRISSQNKYQQTEITLANISTPPLNHSIVPSSTRYVIIAQGERFSPRILSDAELRKLMKRPTGCGEQNIFFMAFNLYTLKYLNETHRLFPETEKKGIGYLKKAFRQQLFYRKTDGSYSTFDRLPSSVWLTAFVTKIMCQTTKFIPGLDTDIIDESLIWLGEKQTRKGNWHETNPVLHEEAFGGVKGNTALTAYILIALNECKELVQTKVTIGNVDEQIKNGERYLVKEIKSIKDDAYALALITYSLSFSSNSKLVEIRESLYHELYSKFSKNEIQNFIYWKNNYEIETASYALLALSKLHPEDSTKYFGISNWLSSKQINATFANTQNTIVALEALSKFYVIYKNAERVSSQYLKSNVSFDQRHKRSLSFEQEGLEIMKTISVDSGTRKVGFETVGNGLGKVQIVYMYNTFSPDNNLCHYDLDIQLEEYKHKALSGALPALSPNYNVDISFGDGYTNMTREPSMKRKDPDTAFDMASAPEDIVLDDENPSYRLMNICVMMATEFYKEQTEIVMIEVTILSGYKVIESDLERIVSDSKSNCVSYYELSDFKVTFYFKKIPSARKCCFHFKMYRNAHVENLQSALVQIFDYNSNSKCSVLKSGSIEINLSCLSFKDGVVPDCTRMYEYPTTSIPIATIMPKYASAWSSPSAHSTRPSMRWPTPISLAFMDPNMTTSCDCSASTTML